MMAYMGTVTVILLNILIAQMSTTYTQAKSRSSGIWCGSDFTAHTDGEISFSGKYPLCNEKEREQVHADCERANALRIRASINEKADWASAVSDSERLFSVQKLRVKYYKEGGWISEMNLARGL